MNTGEFLGMGAGGAAGILTKAAVGIGGITAMFKMHESVEADERAIILNRGRVKVDREKLAADFGTKRARKAQKMMTKLALEQGATKREAKNTQLDRTEYAAVYGAGSHFVFFSLRAIRKVKITHQTTGMPVQSLEMKKGKYQLDSSITWATDGSGQNPARAMLRVPNQEERTQRVASQVAGTARDVILDLDETGTEAYYKSAEVLERIKERCGDDLIRTYGAVLLNYDILSLAPSEAEIQRKLRFEGADGQHIEPESIIQTGLRLVTGNDAAPDTGA